MNKGISEINRLGVCNKSELDTLIGSVVSSVRDGDYSAMELISTLKKMEYVITEMKKATKKDVLFELSNYEKDFKLNGVSFTKAPVSTTYDFSNCNHNRYNEVKNELDALNGERKELESFLKTISEKNPIMDEEGTVINPPIKKQADGVKLSIK